MKKTKAQKAALKIFPEKVWMEQIGYVNPYHKEREGFTLCWEQLKTKFVKLYKDACKSYNKALLDADTSDECYYDKIYHEGKKIAYLTVLEELMSKSELNELMKSKDEDEEV